MLKSAKAPLLPTPSKRLVGRLKCLFNRVIECLIFCRVSDGWNDKRDVLLACCFVCGVMVMGSQTNRGLRMPGVFVVHLDWLMNSVWHCRRERETMFLLAGVRALKQAGLLYK